MSILAGLTDKLLGGLSGTIFDAIKTYFPPDLSPEQQAAIKLQMEQITTERARVADAAVAEAEQRLTERISLLEGTAVDLKALPIIGPLLLVMRGLQRPAWGYGTMYVDVMWFSGRWGHFTDTQESALWVINFLVLGFLFGERAIQNVAPLISEIMAKRLPK